MLDIRNEYFSLSLDLSGSSLTPRERDIVCLLLAGHSVTTIGRMRHRSVKTVSAQKMSAYKKLGISGDISLFPGLISKWGMRVTHSPSYPTGNNIHINIGANQAD